MDKTTILAKAERAHVAEAAYRLHERGATAPRGGRDDLLAVAAAWEALLSHWTVLPPSVRREVLRASEQITERTPERRTASR